TWNKAGAKGKKVAEIEHFELLLDGLSLVNEKKAHSLKTIIEQVKAELEKMI
ncbi:MAG: hypothetical protein ICV66_14230, partial [Chitinophagaceae bacterium]|nr:hypothetical protein [Chitinophagaceae bacterium]